MRIEAEESHSLSRMPVQCAIMRMVGICLVVLVWSSDCAADLIIEGITFATEEGKLYVPLEEAACELHWQIQRDDKVMYFGPQATPVEIESLKRLLDGTELVSVPDIQKAGAEVTISPEGGPVTVHNGRSTFNVVKVAKRVEVNLTKQQLSAWEGNRLVLQTHISSGRHNSTPAGEFTAGPYKARMHHSKKYKNAPMPWSVQIRGHVFIHGFTSVPNYPASHGCIRMPLDGGNPAKFFYEWVDAGTPVHVMP